MRVEWRGLVAVVVAVGPVVAVVAVVAAAVGLALVLFWCPS